MFIVRQASHADQVPCTEKESKTAPHPYRLSSVVRAYPALQGKGFPDCSTGSEIHHARKSLASKDRSIGWSKDEHICPLTHLEFKANGSSLNEENLRPKKIMKVCMKFMLRKDDFGQVHV